MRTPLGLLPIGSLLLYGCTQAKPAPDAEIAGVLEALDRGEIAQAELAADRGLLPTVRGFALRMERIETEAEARHQALFDRLGIAPLDSELGRSVNSQAAALRSRLLLTSGSTFDQAYLCLKEITLGNRVSLSDSELLEQVQDAELRAELWRDRLQSLDLWNEARSLVRAIPSPDQLVQGPPGEFTIGVDICTADIADIADISK